MIQFAEIESSRQYAKQSLSSTIAAIAMVLSWSSLLFFNYSINAEVVGWTGLGVYTASLITIFGGLVLFLRRRGIEENPLTIVDFATIAVFAALMKLVDSSVHFVPGIAYLYYSFPQIGSAVLYYFPLGIVVATALRLSPKPGVAFTLVIVEGVIEQVFFPNVVWLLRDIVVALCLEAYYITSKRGTVGSLILMGLMFGIVHGSVTAIYQIYLSTIVRSLSITLLAAIFDGIAMAVGAFLGYAIGERASAALH